MATNLPRTVARRILKTLTELGFTVANGKTFHLTPKILNLGLTYLTSLPFWSLAQEVLEHLSADVKESVLDEERNVVAAPSVNLRAGETTESKAIKKLLSPLRDAAEHLRAMTPSFLSSAAQTIPR